MRWFRNSLRENRAFILTLLVVCLYSMAGGPDYAHAYQVHQQKEERLAEIAKILDIPVDELRPDHVSLWETVGDLLGIEAEHPVKKAGQERLKEVLRKHEEQIAANPYRDEIEAVKAEHAIYRIAGALDDVLELTDPPGRKALRPLAKQAMLRNLDVALEEGFTLPPLAEDLPAKAQRKHAEMQRRLDDVARTLRPIVAEAVAEKADPERGPNPEKIVRMKQAMDGVLARPERAPRFADRPLPLQRVEKTARVEKVDAATLDLHPTAALVRASSQPPSAPTPAAKSAIAPEVAALAAELGNSPARIFRYVHDTIEPDLKWGAYRSALGTLWEKQGSAWDQALLLRDLLAAAGINAHFEVGQIEVSVPQLLELTGVDDPLKAGNMLATAGVPVVLLASGSQIVAARMPHVWLAAHLDYVPNRGVTSGTPDTWVRIDSYLKEGAVRVGNPVYRNVPFSLMDYLEAASEASPRRVYEDALTVYNVAADLWSDLDEIRYDVRVLRRDYPFIPGTLRAKILSVDSQPTDLHESARARVELVLERADGSDLLAWGDDAVDLYGRTVEIAYRGATEDDRALIESYGGLFATPPYLVDLAPEIRVDGVVADVGSSIGAAEDVEIRMSLVQPDVGATPRTHVAVAGEQHVLAYDWGRMPTELVERHLERQATLDSSDPSRTEAERLYLLGSTYLRNLGRDLEDLSAIRWHRLIGLGIQGLVTQGGRVTTSIVGAPIAFAEDARNVDIAAMTLGMFPATTEDRPFSVTTFELLGAQASYLEGTVFGEVAGTGGIAAVSALTRSKREGQQLHRLDSSNAATVLQTVDLGEDVEDAVLLATSRGQIAWVAEERLALGSWSGTGYVLEDPTTGAAGYMISGGLGGGMELGEFLAFGLKALGREPWIADTPMGKMLLFLIQLLGSSSPPGGPQGSHGDPVNLSNGNLWFHAFDLWLEAPGLPVSWTRTYNSQSNRTGPLGYGWSSNYSERLEEQPDGSVIYIEADGTEHFFTQENGSFRAPPGKHLQLELAADQYLLSSLNGMVFRFDAGGRLLGWTDGYEAGVSLEYDSLGNLTRVRDGNGRQVLTIEYFEGRISRVTDLAGRTLQYRYSGDDLTEFEDVNGNVWQYVYDVEHNLIARVDPLGHTHQWSYDSSDRCYQFIDPLGNVENYAYQGGGHAAVVRNGLGHALYVEMDERGRPTLSVDPLGNISRSTWDEDNNRLTVKDPRDGLTTMTYDDNGNVLTVTDALGQVTRQTFEPDSQRIARSETPDGLITEYTYDSAGNLVEQAEVADGARTVKTMTYDASGALIETRDPEDGVRTFEWDPSTGGLVAQTDPDGSRAVLALDELGRPTTLSDDTGLEVTIGYNSRGQVVRMANSRGYEWTREYDALGRLVEETSPVGTRISEYDGFGRLIAHTDEAGATRRLEYDAAGNETVSVDYRGNRTVKIYDAVGRPLALVDAEGFVWSVDYVHDFGTRSPCGSCTTGFGGRPRSSPLLTAMTVINPLGERFEQHLDLLGRMTEMTNAAGETTHFTYDASNRRTSETDPEGRTTRWEWDALGSLRAVVDGEGNRTEYEYDNLGQLLRRIDANGRTWSQSWNALGHRVTATNPLDHVEQWEWDPFGNVTSNTTANGDIVSFGYEAGLLASVALPGGEQSVFTYDANNRLTSAANSEKSLRFEYDALGRVVRSEDLSLGKAITYEYDPNGNRIKMSSPESDVRFFYDSRDFLTEQQDSRTGVFSYEYDAAGKRTKIRFPNGTSTEYNYDAAGRLTATITRDPQGSILDGNRYTLDASGLRTNIQSLRTGLVQRLQYDDARRLIRWEKGDGTFEAYTYDAVGNRLSLETPLQTTIYEYDAADRLTRETKQLADGSTQVVDYVWDAAGNLVQRSGDGVQELHYTWDALDRLLEVDRGSGGTVSYGYAPDGTRVRKSDAGGTERFLHSFDDLIGVYDGAGDLVSYFSFGPEVDQPLARYSADGTGGPTFLHHDAQGSITATSDSEGALLGTATYSAFGGLDEQTGEMVRFGYTGRESDQETELDYFRTRYYSPNLGRFISADWFEGTLDNPSTTHDYTFVGNDPFNNRDPGGRFYWVVLAFFFGFIAGVVTRWIGAIIINAAVTLVVWVMWFLLSVVMALAVAFLCIYGWDPDNTRPYDCLAQFATYFQALGPFAVIFIQIGIILDLALIFIMRYGGEIDLLLARLLVVVVCLKALLVYLTIEAIRALTGRPTIYRGVMMLAAVVIWSYIAEWISNLLFRWNPGQKPDSVFDGLPDPNAPGI